MKQLAGLDASFLYLETPQMPMHVGALHLLQLPVGYEGDYVEDLREHPGDWAMTAGRIGYIAKGVALVIVGFFFLVAAWQADPDKAQGLDGALKTLRDAPAGPFLLTLVAVGIAAYGVYSFARSRYARV